MGYKLEERIEVFYAFGTNDGVKWSVWPSKHFGWLHCSIQMILKLLKSLSHFFSLSLLVNLELFYSS